MGAMFVCEECNARLTLEDAAKHVCAADGQTGIEVPDVVGEILGWRAWEVHVNAKGAVELSSVTKRTNWPPGQWLVATCTFSHTRIPAERCSCGIYAAKEKEQLLEMHYHRFDDNDVVIGEVALAGKVIPGSQGWRAEKAKPKSLYVPYTRWKLCEPLKVTYDVTVHLSNTLHTEESEEEI